MANQKMTPNRIRTEKMKSALLAPTVADELSERLGVPAEQLEQWMRQLAAELDAPMRRQNIIYRRNAATQHMSGSDLLYLLKDNHGNGKEKQNR